VFGDVFEMGTYVDRKMRIYSMIIGLMLMGSTLGSFLPLSTPVIADPLDPWWNINWLYRKPIIIDPSKVDTDLSNFPVLIDVTDSDLMKAQSDGDDFVFTDVNQIKLDHEIEEYDPSTGHLIAWVSVPLLSSSSPTTLYLYYGSVSGNQENIEAVWDTDYMEVHHLVGTTYSDLKDSTGNDNDVTGITGTPIFDVEAKIGPGIEFVPNSGITLSDADSLDGYTTAATFETWIMGDNYATEQGVIAKWGTGNKAWFIELSPTTPNTKIMFYFTEDGVTTEFVFAITMLTAGEWYHVAVVWQSNQVPLFYLNGAPLTTWRSDTTSSLYSGSAVHNIGQRTPFYFDGLLDEIRISDVTRSADWLATQYRNQENPVTFYSVGIEETGATTSYIISASAGTGGDIDPSGDVVVFEGSPKTFTIIADPGFSISDVEVNSVSKGDISEFTFSNVHDNHTIAATFVAIPTHTITTSVGAGGSIDPSGGVIVYEGDDKTFTIIADPGFSISDVEVDSVSQGVITEYTFTNVIADHLISATFEGVVNPWWNGNWDYRKVIGIDSTKVVADLTDFPVLIDLVDLDLTKAQTDGDDFAFADVSGSKLDHEIESYDSSTGHLLAWVRVPLLSSVSDTVLYLYYGNAGASSQQNPVGVWDSYYMMVQHLDETTGTQYDSTIYNNDGTPTNGVIQGTPGKIDGADEFDGSDDYLEVLPSATLSGYSTAFTAETWVKLDASRRQAILNKYMTSGNQRSWYLDYDGSRGLGLFVSQNGISYQYAYAAYSLTTGTWYHVTAIWESGLIPKFYVNGIQIPTTFSVGTAASIYNNILTPLYIGRSYNTVRNLDGMMDEVRISNVARSDEWLATQNSNQENPDTFYSIGSEELGVTSYTISASAGIGGVIDPSGAVAVVEGDNQTFTITADPGFSILDVEVNSVFQGPISEYTFTNVSDDHVITATFAAVPSYIINATAGAGGSIDPSGLVVVNEGDYELFTILAYPNYHILDVVVDSVSQGALSEYNFTNVNDNHTIEVTFETNPSYTISASAGTGGYIDPTGLTLVYEGANQTFTIVADPGYNITDVVVDSVSQGTLSNYTFTNVSDDHVITATFTAIPSYIINATAGTGGSIDPLGNVTVYDGDDQTFTITPDPGYHIHDVLMNGFTVGVVPEYTFYGVSNNHTIEAIFGSGTQHTISASAGVGGSINPSGDIIVLDSLNQTFTVTVDSGYGILDLVVDGISQGALLEYTFVNVLVDHDIVALFYGVNAPTHNDPLLESLGGTSMTNETLYCYNQTTADSDGDKVNNVYNWYVDDKSLTQLLLPFDLKDDLLAKDYSGYDNHGTVTDASWLSNGVLGGAYAFDGNSSITIPDDPSIRSDGTQTGLSIEFWIKTSEYQRNTIIAEKKVAGSDDASFRVNIRDYSQNRVSFGVTTSEGWRYRSGSSGTRLYPGNWNHIVCVYDADVGLRIYRDGVYRTGSSWSGAISSSIGEDLYIGNNGTAPVDIGLIGQLDNFVMYEYALTDEEIALRYQETSSGYTNVTSLKVGDLLGTTIKCEVTPNDGNQDGVTKTSDTMTIVNTPPEAHEVKIMPRADDWALTTDDLVVYYNYYDFDGQNETGTEIKWYKDSAHQAGLDGDTVIPSASTNIGEEWNVTIKPSDGANFGLLETSLTLTISSNTPPTQTSPNLVSSSGLGSNLDNLTAYNQTTVDVDGDPVTNIYNWYADDISFTNLNMPFDTQNLLLAKDYSGYDNHGTGYGTGWIPDGQIGGAITFDGDDYIKIASDPTLTDDGTWSEMTLEYWINPAIDQNGARVINKNTEGTDASGMYMAGFNTGGSPNTVFFGVTIDGDYLEVASGGNTIPSSNWSHIVGIYKSGDGIYLYINGEQRDYTPDVVGNIDNSSTMPLFIGSAGGVLPESSSHRYFNGSLDELRIYNKALTPQQVIQRYNDTKDGLSNNSTIVAEETSDTEIQVWKCEITPNDGYQDGNTLLSNTIDVQNYHPMIYSSILNNSIGISQDITSIGFELVDLQGDRLDYTVTTTPNIGSGSWFNVLPGLRSLSVSSVNAGTVYTWEINVTDGTYWTYHMYKFSTSYLFAKWDTSGLTRGFGGVIIADVNGDGYEEVITAGEGMIACLSGLDGSILWTHIEDDIRFYCQPQMADLTNDGILEVIVPLELPPGVLALHANNGSVYWKLTGLSGSSITSSLVVGDIDGSGYPVIFAGVEDVEEPLEGTLYKISSDGQVLGTDWVFRPCAGGFALADAEGDGVMELFMSDRSGPAGRTAMAWNAHTLELLWERPDLTSGASSSHTPLIADINGDDILDFVNQNQRSPGRVYVLNATSGETLSQPYISQMPAHYQPSLHDIDNDGHYEILMADGEHTATPMDLLVFDLVDNTEDMRIEAGDMVYGPQLGDLTGDGIVDIIAVNMTGINLYDNNGTLLDQITNLQGWLTYGVVQDIDDDGFVELVVQSMGGRIYAFDTMGLVPDPRARSEVQFYSERRLGVAEYIAPPGRHAPAIIDPYPVDGSTDIPTSLSELRFTLIDYQLDLMDYTITTTPNIGSDSGTNVPSATYTLPVSGLAPGVTYSWTVSVTDGTNNFEKTYTFTTQTAGDWYNLDWQYRKPLSINPAEVEANLVNIPILVDITNTDLMKAQTDGDDFVFTNIDQVKLDHEIESYDSTTGHLIAWVNVPALSSSTYTTLYVYYGNGAATNQENIEAVWDSRYKEVHHFVGTSAEELDDSTVNNNDVTGATGTPIYDVTGKIGSGVEFVPNSGLTISDADNLDGFTEAATFEAWIKSDNYAAEQGIMAKWGTGNKAWFIELSPTAPNTKIMFYFTEDGSTTKYVFASTLMTVGDWYHVAVVWQSNQVPLFYLNGNPIGTWRADTTLSLYSGTAIQGIGQRVPFYFDGLMDEVRISDVVRTEGWFATQYNNQVNPSAFMEPGSEETP